MSAAATGVSIYIRPDADADPILCPCQPCDHLDILAAQIMQAVLDYRFSRTGEIIIPPETLTACKISDHRRIIGLRNALGRDTEMAMLAGMPHVVEFEEVDADDGGSHPGVSFFIVPVEGPLTYL